MNNPVGWLGYHEGLLVSFLQTQEQVELFLKNTDTAGKVLPVYTHPMRELSDEEIMNEWYSECCPNGDLIKFARAILKKASDK